MTGVNGEQYADTALLYRPCQVLQHLIKTFSNLEALADGPAVAQFYQIQRSLDQDFKLTRTVMRNMEQIMNSTRQALQQRGEPLDGQRDLLPLQGGWPYQVRLSRASRMAREWIWT